MAERRMFAKTIVLSDSFLDMPMSSRCLYFTLGMLSDDDGFVNSPKSIMRQCGASQDDLLNLMQKKFIIGFESGVIVIKHWRINNYLQKDRYTETKYLDEKSQLSIDDRGVYTDCIQNVYTGKDSIGKDSIDKVSIEDSKPLKRHKFGEYSNVLLTQEDYAKWHEECTDADGYIEKLSAYMASTGKSYKNHLATMRNWYRKDKEKGSVPVAKQEASYNLDEIQSKAETQKIKYERKN